MMRCPKCNTENRDSAKFCDECGFELSSVTPYSYDELPQDILNKLPDAESSDTATFVASTTTATEVLPPIGDDLITENDSGGYTSDDEFAASFTESGTVNLTHIAEKLRKPETSGSFVFVPDDEDELPDVSGDDIFPVGGQDIYHESVLPEKVEVDAGDMLSGITEDVPVDMFDGIAQDASIDVTDRAIQDTPIDMLDGAIEDAPTQVIENPLDAFPDDNISSIDTAPLSVTEVNHAIREDDQSTLMATASAMASMGQTQQTQHVQPQRSSSTLEMPPMPIDNKAPKDAHSFLAFSSNRGHRFGKRFKVGLVISLCVIAALIAILGVTYALQIWGGKTIPNVIGTSSADAKYLLEESGFFVEEKLVVSDDIEGIVIEVWPEQGSRQPLGSTVTIGVSTFRAIPDIIGMPFEEAKTLLDENGYTDIELVMKKSDEDEGNILAVSPSVGTRANADAHVTIEVAQPYTVPDVIGEYQDSAISILESEGFTAEIKYEYGSDELEGSVIKTVPAVGDPCKTTSPVQIYIAISRATELGEYTSNLFTTVDTLTYGGNLYQYVKGSFATAGCPDDNTCNFTVRARLLDQHTWPDGRTDTWLGDEVTISSTAGWSDNNEFLYMDPNLLL